jgi:hypothetical protein
LRWGVGKRLRWAHGELKIIKVTISMTKNHEYANR